MKTKLNRSNIQINGEIWITDYTSQTEKKIELQGLKQSKSGIYEIRNKFNNKRYIGMARNLVTRKQHHISDLIKGIHKSKEMQSDFEKLCLVEHSHLESKYVEEIFEFNVIIYCYPASLNFWELLLIDNVHPEYNTKKKKVMPKKVFDIEGKPIEEIRKELIEGFINSFSEDDCEEEMM